MEFYQRELLIYRCIAGYIKFKIKEDLSIFIYSPTSDIRYMAQEKYLEAYNEAIDSGVLDETQTLNMMRELKLWSNLKEDLLIDLLPKQIEDLKVKIYQANLNSNLRKQIRSELRLTEKRLIDLLNERHQFDYITAHGIATYNRLNFIITNCTKYIDGRLYDWVDVDINTITSFVNTQILSEQTFRDLVKHEPWYSIWTSAKKNGNLFGKSTIELTDDQKRLINYSTFYDNIYEHQDCPYESIVEDDDMLDGWVILQRREKESNQNKKIVDEKLTNPKIANAQEVFIVANSVEDIKKIEDANTTNSQRVKKQRLNLIKNKENVVDSDFSDVRQELIVAQNKQYLDNVRKK